MFECISGLRHSLVYQIVTTRIEHEKIEPCDTQQ